MSDSVSTEGTLPEKKTPIRPTVNNGEIPPNPTPLELEVYKILATLFNSEETSFWTRNNILVAIHGALIAATAAILGGAEKVLTPGAPVIAAILLFGALAVLSLVGFCMALTWLFMVGRSERIADTVSGQLKAIERDFAVRPSIVMRQSYQAFITFGEHLDPATSNKTFSPRRWNNNIRLSVLWRRVGWGLTFLWAVLLALFIFLALELRPPPAPTPSNNAVLTESFERLVQASEQSAIQAEHAAKSAAEAAAHAQKVVEQRKKKPANTLHHRIKKNPNS